MRRARLRNEQAWTNPSARWRAFCRCPATLRRGLRYVAGIARRGEVAEAEPGVIVAGTDDPVEVDFGERHAGSAPDRQNAIPGFEVEHRSGVSVDH